MMLNDWTSPWRTVALAALSGVVMAAQAAPATEPVSPLLAATTSQQPSLGVENLSALSTDAFLRLLVARSVEVQYSKLASEVAGHLAQGESALYEPTGFMSIRDEGRNRQRTADERLQNSMTAGTAILAEKGHSDEIGIRSKLPTGAELTISYKAAGKSNNLIPLTSTFDTEYTTLLNLSLKQPLMRNAWRSITETDRRVAELEHKIALQQFIQQTQKTSIDGLGLYWQLYRAQETVKLRKEAIATTEALLADTKARIAAGRAPASSQLEMGSVLLNREAEFARSLQALREAQGKIFTAINIVWNGSTPAAVTPALHTDEESALPTPPPLEDLLRQWSPYQVSQLKQQQAEIRLGFAKNQTLPVVDVVVGYGGTGFNNKLTDASQVALDGTYPDWYVGLNVEIPLGGNKKAQQQFRAQSARLTQAELELEAIRSSFANDVAVRLGDLQNALAVLGLSKKEVKLRQNIFDNERLRVQIGSGSLGSLIQKQVDFIESKQRMLENQIRYEVALATWQYVRGSLLSDNGIQISEESSVAQ